LNPALLLLQAVRAPSLLAGAMPVFVLTGWASAQGEPVSGAVFAATLLGMVALQAGVNVVNDLYDDESGLDADPEFANNAFPLGSRVIQAGALGRRGMWILAVVCFGTGAACGLWLDTLHPGHVVLGLGVTGAVLGWLYTAPPLRIAYHGAGEPVIFLLFGPLAGGGALYVQTGSVDAGGMLLSCIVGWLAMAVLFLHHFPQREADGRHGKKTPIVRLGADKAGRLVPPMLAMPFVVVAAAVAGGLLPAAALAIVLGFPFALKASRIALSRPDEPSAMTAAFGQVMGTLVVGGGGLAAALGLVGLLA
jgi:1,4-dihydroxy-2-naphthoate octaprenyltransferase